MKRFRLSLSIALLQGNAALNLTGCLKGRSTAQTAACTLVNQSTPTRAQNHSLGLAAAVITLLRGRIGFAVRWQWHPSGRVAKDENSRLDNA